MSAIPILMGLPPLPDAVSNVDILFASKVPGSTNTVFITVTFDQPVVVGAAAYAIIRCSPMLYCVVLSFEIRDREATGRHVYVKDIHMEDVYIHGWAYTEDSFFRAAQRREPSPSRTATPAVWRSLRPSPSNRQVV